MFRKIYSKYRNWKQRDFLKWRDDLSDYERDYFMPEIKGRCEELLKYFKMIDEYSLHHVDDKAFGATLRGLMMSKELEKLIPKAMQPPTDEVLAQNYFVAMRSVNQENFIDPLKKVITEFNRLIDLKSLGSILTQVNQICSTVLQVKEKLFLYGLSGFATVHDKNTNQLVLSEPKELKVMLVPFQITMENIYGVANATSGTIHQWHKEQMEWKTNCLQVLSERLAQRNNLLTIIVAVAISWLFLSVTKPYESLLREHEFTKLKEKVIELHTREMNKEQQVSILQQENQKLLEQVMAAHTDLKKPTSPQSQPSVPTSLKKDKKDDETK